MTLTLSKVAEVLIADGQASGDDGEILTRFVSQGLATREELDTALDLIEKSSLSLADKQHALENINQFLEQTAKGLEATITGLSVAQSEKLETLGVRTNEDLLYVAATPSQRYALADDLGMTEKQLRRFVKQADLQRVPGISPKLAWTLVDISVDSVPELACRNAASLYEMLSTHLSDPALQMMGVTMPSEEALQAMIDAAQALPKVVVFGDPAADLSGMSIEQRIQLMRDVDELLKHEYLNPESGLSYLADRDLTTLNDAYQEEQLWVLSEIADRLSWHGVDTSAEALLENPGSVDQDEAGFYFDIEPNVVEFRGPDGSLVGAAFQWGTDDGSEGEYWTVFYDHLAGRFIGYEYSETANGETELEIYEDHPAPSVDVEALRQAADEVSTGWTDEAIMDGIAKITADKGEYGWGNPGSFAKSLLTQYFEDDSDHEWQGWVDYSNVYPYTPSATTLAATAINDLGIMYADQSEVQRIADEIKGVLAGTGSLDQVAYATSSGLALVPDVNEDQPVRTVLHCFVNKNTGVYVAVIAREGSYAASK